MRPDPVSLAGIALSLASLLGLPNLVLRPNRILSGTPLAAFTTAGVLFYIILFLLALLAILALWKNEKPAWNCASGLLAGLALAVAFAAAGRAARSLMEQADPVARVSVGSGLWVLALGLSLVAFASGRRLRRSPWLRAAVLLTAPAALLALLASGALNDLSLLKEYANRRSSFLMELNRHLALAFISVAAGAVAAVPLGLVMFRRKGSEKFIFFFVNLAQTIPTLSLLGMLILPLSLLAARVPLAARLGIRGVGWAPAGIVLFLYALLPIAGNTLAGFRTVPPEAVDAARGMGMRAGEMFLRVELPLAFPVILSGIRTALTQNIGNAILAGLIGGGGMGSVIFLGLAQAAADLVLLGALPVALIALAADLVLEGAIRLITPRGVRLGV